MCCGKSSELVGECRPQYSLPTAGAEEVERGALEAARFPFTRSLTWEWVGAMVPKTCEIPTGRCERAKVVSPVESLDAPVCYGRGESIS